MAIVGIVGNGIVGGTLAKWFEENTEHDVRIYDPPKGQKDFLEDCEAIFISVPVPADESGQDISLHKESVLIAQKYTDKVFIRSTVLPNTNDELGTISMPEFLTERRAFSDMTKYPILCGQTDPELLERIFPNKQIIMMSNTEAELAKYTHNCFGALKVTYFNVINQLCEQYGLDYDKVLKGAMITGFIESTHTRIAQDGLKGYGGKCFPENIISMYNRLCETNLVAEATMFGVIANLNDRYRKQPEQDYTTTSAEINERASLR